MKIALASDHGGFELKEKVKSYLQTKGHDVIDLGCYTEESTDYPEYGKACGEAVIRGDAERGIVICG
jgi:ribose 5-phosphate isomerase B